MRNPKVFGVCVCGLLGGCSDLLGSDTQEVADPAPRLTVTARFHDAIGGTNLRFCGGAGQPACTSGPPVQVRWGVPFSPTDPQSGLGFAPSPTMPLTYDAAFTAGTITHINFPTDSGTASGGVLLDLHLHLDPSGGGATLLDGTATVPIRIDETPNTPPCAYPSVTPCADKVFFTTSMFSFKSTANFTIYDLEVLGFVVPPSTTPVDGLISQENSMSSAQLSAVLHERCVDDDGDGVCDEFDQCLGTTDGPVDDNGCSLSQLCPCDDPWKNHGGYVSCVARESQHFVDEGKLTPEERGVVVSTAGQSDCGKK